MAGKREDQTDRQLGDGASRVSGHVRDDDALIVGGGHVDVVIAGGPDGNQPQPRQLAQNPPPEGSPAEYGDLGAIEPPDYLVLAFRVAGMAHEPAESLRPSQLVIR